MADSPFLTGDAKWIWVSDFDDRAAKGQFVLFRKTFVITEKPTDDILLHVSADTRYRLYLNGKSISFGPCKSYLSRWYYETVNITANLKEGENVMAAHVLRFSSTHDGCFSMIRSPLPGFILHCQFPGHTLHTNESWKAKKDDATELVPDSEWNYWLGPQFLSLNENFDARAWSYGWNSGHSEYDDSSWQNAILGTPQRKLSPMLDPRRLYPRPIPALPEIDSCFDGVVTSEGPVEADAWEALLKSSTPVVVPAKTTLWVEIESKLLTTGFLEISCELHGEDKDPTTIEVLSSECYESPADQVAARTKGDRTDFRNGKLYGLTDRYITSKGESSWSPFWFQTFRYVRLTISTKSEPLTLRNISYRSIHYPLDIRTTLATSSPLITKLWDISINTVRNCMHETYEDCPFYEQNQFAVDTRIQILFTYLLSRDDRLARKAMREFYASRRDDGLVETHFPSSGRSTNIPTFSLFWVLMVSDHMIYFGDEKLVKTYIGAVDGVLNYFDERINELGLVGQFDKDCWAFVDWVDGWFTPGKGFTGLAVPKAYYEKGSATYHTLIYAYTLLKASELQTFLGRHDTAEEYISRQQALVEAVKQHCFDPVSGFFLDGPNTIDERSQHVQVLAVLSGCVSGTDAQRLMRRTVLEYEQHKLAKASLAMNFYVFRAVSEVGVYEECWDTIIQPWKKMIEHNMTTWVESESMPRSDCHGWGAVPLWEIGTEILGVKQRSKAYLEKVIGAAEGLEVQIMPRKSLVSDIQADVFVGDGKLVHVEWNES